MHRLTVGERLTRAYAWVTVALRAIVPVAWVAAAIAAWVVLPSLGGSSTAPLDDIVATDAPAFSAQERVLRHFGSSLATDTAVVQRNERGLTEAEREAHARVARSVARGAMRPAGVRAAVPVLNAPAPGIRWPERNTTIVSYLFLSPDLNLEERDTVAHAYARRLAPAPGSSVGVTGSGPARLEQFEAIDDALPIVTAATVLVILLVVALYFRSIGAPLVTLLTAAVSYAVAVRGLAWAGERAGLHVPSEIEPVLVVLLLGLVTDYTVFFMSEARRRLLRGDDRVPAARIAAASMGPIVLTAGVVVAAGAASLLVAGTDFFRVFGPGLGLSALIVTFVCLTFVPAMLGLAGPRLFGRRVREAAGGGEGRVRDDASPGAVRAGGSERRARWYLRFAGALGTLRASRRHAREEGGGVLPAFGARVLSTRPVALLVVVASVAALAVAAYGGRDAELAVSYTSSLDGDAEARQAADAATSGFGPGVLAPTEILVEHPGIVRDVRQLVALQAAIGRERGVATVLGPREPAGTPLEGLALARDGDAARFAVLREADPTGADAIADHRRLEDRMPALLREAGLPSGARVSYAGETALSAQTIDALSDDLRRVAATAVVVIFLLLALFLRAVVAPLLLVASSALAVAASVGLTTMVLPHALGGTHFTFYVPLVAGVLLIGLGSDYNVFIAGRIRAEARRRRLREAIAVATPAASRAITVAGITLAGTFALLALVPLRPFRELAILMAVGVLVDALFVRPVLIPALIALVGPAAWWPGRLTRPPRSAAFVARVAERSGHEPGTARAITEATLRTLAERIPEREAAEVAAHLPEPLAAAMLEGNGRGEAFDAHEFVTRVAARTGAPRDEAADDAHAVIATLVEALPGTEVDYVRAALSDDYRWLFGDAARPPSTASPDRPTVGSSDPV